MASRPKRPRQPKIDLEGQGFGQFEQTKPPRTFNVRTKPTKATRSTRTKATPKKPTSARRERIIELNLEIKAVQSTRGTREAGDFRKEDSEIINFIMYDIVTKRLAVQLTAAGKWKWYTYFGVSPQAADDFENAASKGIHFNKHIRNSKKFGFHYSFRPGRHI